MSVPSAFQSLPLDAHDLARLCTAYNSAIYVLDLQSPVSPRQRQLLAERMALLVHMGERDTALIGQKALAYVSAVEAAMTSLKVA